MMMRIAALLLLLGALAPLRCFADNTTGTGYWLEQECGLINSQGSISCSAYVAGVSAGVYAESKRTGQTPFCVPSSVTVGQLTDILRLYFQQHPAVLQYNAASLYIAAVAEAYPCPNPFDQFDGKPATKQK